MLNQTRKIHSLTKISSNNLINNTKTTTERLCLVETISEFWMTTMMKKRDSMTTSENSWIRGNPPRLLDLMIAAPLWTEWKLTTIRDRKPNLPIYRDWIRFKATLTTIMKKNLRKMSQMNWRIIRMKKNWKMRTFLTAPAVSTIINLCRKFKSQHKKYPQDNYLAFLNLWRNTRIRAKKGKWFSLTKPMTMDKMNFRNPTWILYLKTLPKI